MPLAQRRIKLNRDLGRKGSTETSASDRAPLGPEKMSSTSDRSASSSVSEGDRSNSTSEGAGRKELSASAERRASRERPGSAGERLQGSDREQDRVSGPDRDRDRVSGSDRDRGAGSERERERDRVSGSSSQKAAATAERDGDRERSTRTERRTSSGGSGGGRSVCLDKLTIGEKSTTTKTPSDHQEKPSVSSKERSEGSERSAKSDRYVVRLLVKQTSISMFEINKSFQWYL